MIQQRSVWHNKPVFKSFPNFTIEHLLIILIITLTVITRFSDLGLRVMSHDEVNHVVPAWGLYQGQGYVHDPVTHGPLQFPLMALSFFLFGDSDFTARLPHALLSIATVILAIFGMRRFLGRGGGILAGFLFLVSPFFLYYGRYARNEAIVGFLGLLLIYSILAYIESGKFHHLVILTIAMALHFTSKETAYIYTAQALLFCLFYLVERLSRQHWKKPLYQVLFIIALLVSLLFAVVTAIVLTANQSTPAIQMVPVTPTVSSSPSILSNMAMGTQIIVFSSLAISLIGMAASLFFLISGFGLKKLASLRIFNLMILQGTLVLPILAAFLIRWLGYDPLDYSETGILRSTIVMVLLTAVSIAIGWIWRPRHWLICAGVFTAIFVLLYSTFFTNGQGIATGVVGSLGYWLSQQGVERGGQPWYYFGLIQLPIYEFLPLIGSVVAVVIGFSKRLWSSRPNHPYEAPENNSLEEDEEESEAQLLEIQLDSPATQPPPTLALFVFWGITSLVAFSLAGEKMPWLTVHIALPLILSASYGLGYLFHTFDIKAFQKKRGWLILATFIVGLVSIWMVISSLLGKVPPFSGKSLEQLNSTSVFLSSFIFAVGSIYFLNRFTHNWQAGQLGKLSMLAFFAILAVLTIRTSYRAAFINYDNAREFLVYAHAARGPKDILEQVEEISYRTTGGKDIMVAYDNDGLYPYWWYFRDYPNHLFYGEKPTRSLREYAMVIVSEVNYGVAEPIFSNNFVKIDYMRLWWPMMDYFNLTWERVWDAIKDPTMRSAIFQIWLHRDYTQYAAATNNTSLTLENWQPSNRFRLYIRKDIVNSLWPYGVKAVAEPAVIDPYEQGQTDIKADIIFGQSGSLPGEFNAPRAIAVAPDDSLYIADTNNNRVQHLSISGEVINTWGSFADSTVSDAPGGTFNNPWGIAVGPDGSVYVADTWNYRIQKFTSTGRFLTMWGFSGQAEQPDAYWGPRAVAVDVDGRVYVVDTGNKRVVVYDANGVYITQFGSSGYEAGQFDEPVGISIDRIGRVYIADTWNQRIQAFDLDDTGMMFTPVAKWDVSAWYGQSLDNKPYLSLDDFGHLFVTDPDGFRVIEFTTSGEFIRYWGDYGTADNTFGMPAGIAVDGSGGIWVSDAGNNRIMHFTLPVQ
ncbi:MAG: glycosyltransferase family 39 protein [Anaerolineaceae bacterium]|nr:glycosyltransferase family 39 protein [Anaerolineaceae bacterium]